MGKTTPTSRPMEITFYSYQAEKKQDRLDANEKPLIITIKQCILKKSRIMMTIAVYHLQKKIRNFGWDVYGKSILVFPTGKF